MAIFTLIVALIIATMAVIFAFQNSISVPVNFLTFSTTTSLAMVAWVALVAGILVGLLVTLPAAYRRSRQASNQKKKVAQLEKTIAEQNEKLVSMQNTIDEKAAALAAISEKAVESAPPQAAE